MINKNINMYGNEKLIIKPASISCCFVNPFDLLGKDETAITRAFAYVLGRCPRVLQEFLRQIGYRTIITDKIFTEIQIEHERTRKEGRTDIEIFSKGKFQVIIEAKIRSNKVIKQRNQYAGAFISSNVYKNKIMCFITNERTITDQKGCGFSVEHLTWNNIYLMLIDQRFKDDNIVNDFVRFYERRIRMKEQKEILIQDLSRSSELDKFIKFNIYERDETFGAPLYFAPYFTKKCKHIKGVGISYLSKVLGVLTIKPMEVKFYKDDLMSYAEGKEDLVKNWVEGVRHKLKSKNKRRTFYFLEPPILIYPPLQKDGGIKKGRGVNWIAAMISKNRCVTFSEFAKHMVSEGSKK